jgi:hypothetical protein
MKHNPEVPSEFQFSSVGEWPTHPPEILKDSEPRPVAPHLDEVTVPEDFFILKDHSSKEVTYPFGPEQDLIKEQLLELIKTWDPTDTRRSHPDTPIPAGDIVLFAFNDPICYIRNLHHAHPVLFIIGNSQEHLDQHTATIWDSIPLLRRAIELQFAA